MPGPRILPSRTAAIAAALLLLFLLIAAAVNVPWALTRMVARLDENKIGLNIIAAPEIPATWPITTPHKTPWPAPEHWREGGVFGCRMYDIRAEGSQEQGNFAVSLQRLGWPLPVIEKKQMWWDWNEPALDGIGEPQPDPRPSLILSGLILNPLIVGGGAWAILIGPWVLAIVITRAFRRRKNRCLTCGYPVGTAAVCTECGASLAVK